MKGVLSCCAALLLVFPLSGATEPTRRVLHVGYGKEFVMPSVAAKYARDGDVIEIEAGNYPGDVAVWQQSFITLRGVGGRPHLKASGANAEGKGIWVLKGNGVTVENIEFSGAKVPDANGAAIRLEGAGLKVRDSYFHDNENGILTGPNKDSEVVVENCEFARNGAGDGQSHNIYIGNIKSFTLRASYSHDASVGHLVKSRAQRNFILYNRIMDEAQGTSSYEVELPAGGVAYVIGNVIRQSPQTENSTIVSYGAEGFAWPANEFYMVGNTVVNDRPNGGTFVQTRAGTTAIIVNNIFVGRGTVLNGPGDAKNNLTTDKALFVDPVNYDYRPRPGSKATKQAVDPGAGAGFSLRPVEEYVHKARSRPRPSAADLGAFESGK